MSRSCGGRVVTWRSPMRIVPEVGASSPAMRRSTVLLPLPDGPTTATSSPSGMWSVRSRTATRPLGNVLFTWFKVIAATSALYGPSGETRDYPALCNQHQNRDRRRRHHRAGKNLSPWHLVLPAKERDGDGHRVPLGTEREREREQELVPAIEKRQDGGGRQGWRRQRQHDLSHHAKAARAVDERGFFHIRGQLAEESGQQPDGQRH